MIQIIEEKKKELYKQAWQQWGSDFQCVIAMEECSELIKEISKIIRGKGNAQNIAEEIADVEIMLEQIKLYFSLYGLVESNKNEKIKRLEKRLKETR